MAFLLPPAPKKYSQQNEQQARRLVQQAFDEAFARLTILEAEVAAGVTPPDPVGPTAGFTSTADFLVVSFTDASVAGDAAITARLWDFGDGTQSTAPNNTSPMHTYPDSGTYTVTLTVTDADGLEDEFTANVTVEEDSTTSPSGAPVFLTWGTSIDDNMPAAYTWWNGRQAADMTPANCVAMLDAFADAGVKTFVRLWRHNFVVDGAGNWQMSLFQQELDRYDTPTLRAKIAQRCQDGTIIGHVLADDILSANLWGNAAPLNGATLDNMAAYSRQLYPDLFTIVRARVFQCGSFNYQWLQSVNAQYVEGRGGVSQGGMTLAQYMAADVKAYADQEEADLAALPGGAGANMKMIYGLNVINGGHDSSGIPGDGSPANQFSMGGDELRIYADELAPRTYRMFTSWERGDDGDNDAYYNRSDIQASMHYIRNLCDSLGD